MKQNDDENKLKGDASEKWVVKKFDPAFFKVKEWCGDKHADLSSNFFYDYERNILH